MKLILMLNFVKILKKKINNYNFQETLTMNNASERYISPTIV